MLNHEEKGKSKARRAKKTGGGRRRKQWWQWLEPVFVLIALFTALVAFSSLLSWSIISFSIPPNVYSIKTNAVDLNNGQYLQVEYPNIVFGGNDPVYVNLILSGNPKVKEDIEFEVVLPDGLILIEPSDQAVKDIGVVIIEEHEKADIDNTEGAIPDQVFSMGVINSQSLRAFQRIKSQSISIQSTSMDSPLDFDIGIETTPWMSARGLVSNTLDRSSPLILLVTGILSGAGTLVFQFAKSRRDFEWDEQQKKEKDFSERLKEDYVGAIKLFVNLDRSLQRGKEPDFETYKRLVEPSGWEDKFPALILEKLKTRKNYEAEKISKNLSQLCNIFDPQPAMEDRYKHLKSLDVFCYLSLIGEPRKRGVTKEEAECVLMVYKHWRELKPLVTSLVHEITYEKSNLTTLNSVFIDDNDGRQILIDANIQKIIDEYVSQLEDDTKEHKAANNINRHFALDINWRPLWSGKDKKLSDKVQRWLSWCWYDDVDEDFSIGSGYAELDNKLRILAVERSVLKYLGGPSPVIVFGNEGMGKTASALSLTDHYRKLAEADNKGESKIFPIYAAFEAGVDIKEWLVMKISRALIDFTADNPRRFLSAPDPQKTAMGRLMLWHAHSEDVLRLNFYSSPFNNTSSDIEQVLEYIKKFTHNEPASKLTKEEMYNLLYMARPDIFEQIYFLWDIRSTAPHDEVARVIKEMEELAIHLAMQNIIIKIFAPLTVREPLGDLSGFHFSNYGDDFKWADCQLRELVEKRIDKFDTLWERGIDDPLGLVINMADHSPRHVIQILIRLMDYVDENLQEGKKLNKNILVQGLLGFEGKR